MTSAAATPMTLEGAESPAREAWATYDGSAVFAVLAHDVNGYHPSLMDLIKALESATAIVQAVNRSLSDENIQSISDIENLAAAACMTSDLAALLTSLAETVERKPGLCRRPEIRSITSRHLSEYPTDLRSGLRSATVDESLDLAKEVAAGLRLPAATLSSTDCSPAFHFGMFRPPTEPPRRPAVLYRWYDSDHVLLYIGITYDMAVRADAHARGSSWHEFAAYVETVHCWDRPQAERWEVHAIKSEHPLFNHQHNDTPEARGRLVAYLVEKGRLDLLAPAVSRG